MAQTKRVMAGVNQDPLVEIRAAVRADSLKFERTPVTHLELKAEPEGETSSRTERENIPEKAEPGVTYRDVRIAWHAGTTLRS